MVASSIKQLAINLRTLCCGALLLLVITWPAQAQTNNTIYACYDKSATINAPRGLDCLVRGELGDLRRVSSPLDCDPRKEIAISWNVQGPMGPAGPQGAKGDTGARGPQGVSPIGTLEPIGPNCQYGGLKYTDAQGAHYVCNGAPGPQGLPGPPANTDAIEARLTTLERAALPVAYVTNFGGGQVSLIDANNIVFATLPIGAAPIGVSLNSSGKRAYVAQNSGGAVAIIDTTSNVMIGSIFGFIQPFAVAANPATERLYVTSVAANELYIVDTSSKTVVASISGLNSPVAVAVNPTGTRAYVCQVNSNSVAVLDTSTNTIIANVPVGAGPRALTLNLQGTRVYVANGDTNTVSVIDTSNNSVVGTLNVGTGPFAV